VRAVSPAPAVLRTAFAVVQLGGVAVGSVAAVSLAACSRDALSSPCPELAPGDLVLSEVRGPQSDSGDFGEWIELFNASGTPLGLTGLKVEVSKLDGSASASLLVRAADVVVGVDGYVVLGRFDQDAEPAHVDYGYRADLDAPLFSSGAIYLTACEVEVDRIIYRELTELGTLALDGAIDPPSAEANNDETAFCVDATLDDANPSAGARGTPGEPNPVCP
jgi:hypothetical protein